MYFSQTPTAMEGMKERGRRTKKKEKQTYLETGNGREGRRKTSNRKKERRIAKGGQRREEGGGRREKTQCLQITN